MGDYIDDEDLIGFDDDDGPPPPFGGDEMGFGEMEYAEQMMDEEGGGNANTANGGNASNAAFPTTTAPGPGQAPPNDATVPMEEDAFGADFGDDAHNNDEHDMALGGPPSVIVTDPLKAANAMESSTEREKRLYGFER